jgi:hypothetical protein
MMHTDVQKNRAIIFFVYDMGVENLVVQRLRLLDCAGHLWKSATLE